MYLKPFLILIILSNILIIYSCTNLNNLNVSEDSTSIIVSTDHAKIIFDKNYLNDSEIRIISTKIETAIVNIIKYFTNKYTENILKSINLQFHIGMFLFGSYSENGTIYLTGVRDKDTSYIYLIVRELIPPSRGDYFLTEGIAVYLNYLYSGFLLSDKNAVNIDEIAKEYYKYDQSKLLISIGNQNYKYLYSWEKKMAYQLFAGTFVKYLIDTYGKDKFMDFYFNIDQIQVYDKSLAALRDDWVKYISQSKD